MGLPFPGPRRGRLLRSKWLETGVDRDHDSRASAADRDASRARERAHSAGSRAKERVELKLSASPDNAKLYLDDRKPLASNPFTAIVPFDHEPHSIGAEAPGHASERMVVLFDKDVDVALRLGWAKPGHRAAHEPFAGALGARAPRAAAPSASAPPPPVSCDPPYFIDENGIRRLRPECLSAK